ncbi:MAG: hypothetical protein PHC44_10195 [Lutispora sp.]|nr:hypothetical protein [Lutispora sp.]
MSNISKEVLRSYIKEQNFKNPTDVLADMKDMFKDVLQEALEAEMDTQLVDLQYKLTTNSQGKLTTNEKMILHSSI